MRYPAFWQRKTAVAYLLVPVAWLFCFVAYCRRVLYRAGIIPRHKVSVPVIVVGNISVGGTGKTPLVDALHRALTQRGYHPGIVLRGYGVKGSAWPLQVGAATAASVAGDEACLHYRHSGGPVVVDPNRVRGARALAAQGCDLVLSDDGLQHYALARDIEILVVDGTRRFGNGWCLPAGPLREPVTRATEVDFVAVQGDAVAHEYRFELQPLGLRRVDGTAGLFPFAHLAAAPVHALAGIGNPERFFQQLRALGLTIVAHALPDHAVISATDLDFGAAAPVVMTAKDAVKCRDFAAPNHYYVDYETTVDAALIDAVVAKLTSLRA